MSIPSLIIMDGCGLSHECVHGGCNGMCVKFGAENLASIIPFIG